MRALHFVLAAVLTCALTASAAAQTVTTTESHWLASAFAGASFGEQMDESSPDFGGTVGYLWRGVFGGEFQANLSPEFDLNDPRSDLLFGEEPWLNSYMANAIGAVPLGAEGRYRPYLSGGLGMFTLESDYLGESGGPDDIAPDDSRFAGNIGGGILGFMGAAGFRFDMRYFNGFGKADVEANDTPEQVIGKQILADLGFWRASGGVVFRF